MLAILSRPKCVNAFILITVIYVCQWEHEAQTELMSSKSDNNFYTQNRGAEVQVHIKVKNVVYTLHDKDVNTCYNNKSAYIKSLVLISSYTSLSFQYGYKFLTTWQMRLQKSLFYI